MSTPKPEGQPRLGPSFSGRVLSLRLANQDPFYSEFGAEFRDRSGVGGRNGSDV